MIFKPPHCIQAHIKKRNTKRKIIQYCLLIGNEMRSPQLHWLSHSQFNRPAKQANDQPSNQQTNQPAGPPTTTPTTNFKERSLSWGRYQDMSQSRKPHYGTWRLIIMFIKSRYCFTLWATQIQSTTYNSPPLRPILILSSHLSLGVLRRVLLSAFLTKIFNAYLFYSTRLTNPSNLIAVRMITPTTCVVEHTLYKHPFHNVHQPPVTSHNTSQLY